VFADAMPAEQERHFFGCFYRRIAHQINTIRISARCLPHAAGIHQWHKNQPHILQHVLQAFIPFQTGQ
jgi:hypothetical protein